MLPSKSASTSNIRTEGLRKISIQSSQIKLAPPRTHTVHETQMHRKQSQARKGIKGKAQKPLGTGRQVERNNHQPDKGNCQRPRGKNPQNKGSASRGHTKAQGKANTHNGIPGNTAALQKDTKSMRGAGHGGIDRNRPTKRPHPGSTEPHPRENGCRKEDPQQTREVRQQATTGCEREDGPKLKKLENKSQETKDNPGPRDTTGVEDQLPF